MDVTPPSLENVYIYGELMFEDTQDHNFTANLVSTKTIARMCRLAVTDSTDGQAGRRMAQNTDQQNRVC